MIRISFKTLSVGLVALVSMLAAPAGANQITYQMVTVGNPGNAVDSTGYGSVDYQYDIGKYHVTIEQYCDFLNAVAKTDTYGLYDEGVNWAPVSGISRGGSIGSYTYTPTAPVGPSIEGITAGNRPITKLTWFSAARFTNWMANGQPTGAQSASTTEQGAYTLDGKNTGSQVPRNTINPNTGGHADLCPSHGERVVQGRLLQGRGHGRRVLELRHTERHTAGK